MNPPSVSRRDFLLTSTLALAAAPAAVNRAMAATDEPIIDIHQHLNYGGKRDPITLLQNGPARTDEELIAHQRAMGVTRTILLPAGRPLRRASTHDGRSNGLLGTVSGNDAALALAQRYPDLFAFGANEVSDLDDAPRVVETYLRKGACVIGEQKFGVECDSPQMQTLYRLAETYDVPILLHWQHGSFNHGFSRFHRMLEKFPRVTFIGHAQTWWAHIDRAYVDDEKNLYPKGRVTPGGLTDRYLSDYPNMYGDLSAGSGENAFKRDPDHAKAFIERHQDKLLFGSDCADPTGAPSVCSGVRQIAQIRRFSSSKAIERKLLHDNARRVFKLERLKG